MNTFTLKFLCFLCFLSFISPTVASAKGELDGEWKIVKFDLSGITAWSNATAQKNLNRIAKINSDALTLTLLNDGETQSFRWLINPSSQKNMKTEDCNLFDPNEKGSMDPKVFNFSKIVKIFQANDIGGGNSIRYQVIFDSELKKMVFSWDGGKFLLQRIKK